LPNSIETRRDLNEVKEKIRANQWKNALIGFTALVSSYFINVAKVNGNEKNITPPNKPAVKVVVEENNRMKEFSEPIPLPDDNKNKINKENDKQKQEQNDNQPKSNIDDYSTPITLL